MTGYNEKMKSIIIITLLFISYQANSQIDSIKNLGIDLSISHNPTAAECIYIIKVNKKLFFLDSISPEIVKGYEIKRGRFLSDPTKKYQFNPEKCAILIIIKRRFDDIVLKRLNKYHES